MISGFTCGNCGYHSDEHADGGLCLFAPTKFRMMDAVELVAAREAARTPTFKTFQTVGVGIANVGAVSKLRWNGGGAPVVLVPKSVTETL